MTIDLQESGVQYQKSWKKNLETEKNHHFSLGEYVADVVHCNYRYVLTHRAANGLEVCAREAEPNAFKWMNGLFVCE